MVRSAHEGAPRQGCERDDSAISIRAARSAIPPVIMPQQTRSETPLVGRSETPLAGRSETPLVGRSESPLVCRSETPLAGRAR